MAEEIKLSTGLKTYKVRFTDEDDVVEISFKPTDSDLPKRLMESKGIIEKKLKKVKEIEYDEDGEPKEIEDCINYYNQINKTVYDTIDYAFGHKISDKIFKHCSPFAIVDGEYFIMNFLNTITPIIQNDVQKSNEAANKNMSKYLEKYKKYRK